MAITASAQQKFQVEFDQVFKNKGLINGELNNTPIALVEVAKRQNVNTKPLMDGTGKMNCAGVEVWYAVADNLTLPTVSATPINGDCTLTDGDTLSTEKRTYALNIFEKPTPSKMTDDDCANLLKYAAGKAKLLASQSAKIASALNNYLIAMIEANKSVAVAGNLPDGVTIVGGEYTIAGSAYWTGAGAANIIPILDQLALSKGLTSNYYILSGKSLAIPRYLATAASANDNERSYNIIFGDRDRIVNDIRNLDTLIGADVIYLIDPAAIVTFFYNIYSETPTATNDSEGTVVYSIPFIYYTNNQDGVFNQSVVMWNNNGVMTPARLDVREQKVCVPGTNGDIFYNHIFEVNLKGLLDMAPSTDPNMTGIIRVNKA